MAAFNFPNSPSTNDLHTENNVTWKWDGTMWNRVSDVGTTLTQLNVTGVSTFAGNVHVGGVLTYEDVKNVDSVGIITARTGLSVTAGDVVIPDTIVHAGDTNTKIRFPAADTFSVETAGLQNFKVNGTRVALTSPSGTNTTLRLQHQGNSGYGDIILDRQVNAFIIDNDPSNASNNQSYFSVKNKGTTNLHIKYDGKIGINTSSPARLIHAYESTNNNLLFLESGDTNVDIIQADTGGSTRIRNSQGSLVFYVNGDANSSSAANAVTGLTIDGDKDVHVYDDLFIPDKIIHEGDTNTAIRFPSADTITAETGGSERLRITSGGKTLIHGGGATGANDTATILENGNTLNIHGTSSSDGISVVRYSANYGAYGINIGKSRNNTFGTNTLVQDGNELGHISFYGADGTDFEMAAQITGLVDGDPATGGDGTDMPGALSFRTTPEGSDSPIERLRINSEGIVWLNNGNPVSSSLMILDKDGSGEAAIRFYNAGSNKAQIALDSSEELTFDVNGGERLRIDSSGQVNIGAAAANTAIHATGPFSGATPKFEVKLGGASNSYTRLINITNPGGQTGSESLGRVGIKLSLGSEASSGESNKSGAIYAESTSTYNNATALCLATNNTERLRITSAGKVGIGTNSPSFFTHIQGDGVTNDVLKITARGSGQMVNIQNHSNVPNIVRFANYLGNAFWDVQYNTDNSFTLDYNDAEKFRITSTGIIQCGTSAVLKAEINNAVSGHKFISQCDDNNNGFEIYQQHGSTATRNTLAVYDNRGNSTSKQLAFAVIGNGNVSIGDGNLVVANGHGIDFSATGNGNGTMGNELLDDYEEGSWSPTIYGGTTAGSYSYQANRTGGKYTKIGNMVYIEGVLRIETINSAGAGDLYMGGLPYSTGAPMASAWVIGKGVQVLMYGTSGNTTASIAEPPFVGTAAGGSSAFNIRSYGKNLNVMPQIEDFDNQWWIFQIAGWYPVS